MWVAAIVVIGKLILVRKDKCFMALPINIKDPRKSLKIPSVCERFCERFCERHNVTY